MCNCTDEGMVERAMRDEAMGMDVMAEPVRQHRSRLDEITEMAKSLTSETRRQMEEGFMSNARNVEDIWRRLDRIEKVLNLAPIGDEGPRPGW